METKINKNFIPSKPISDESTHSLSTHDIAIINVLKSMSQTTKPSWRYINTEFIPSNQQKHQKEEFFHPARMTYLAAFSIK